MAAEVTGHKQKAAWLEHVLPPVEQVQPGLWSIPVEIPIAPLRYVLVYVLELDDGIAIIDSGWNDEKSYETLVNGLAVGGYQLSDIKDVLITHVHPDHFGLARRVREETGARITLHRTEAATLMTHADDAKNWTAEGFSAMLADGVPEDEAREFSPTGREFRSLISDEPIDILIEDGDRLHLPGWNLDGIWTPGHTPGHMCFLDVDRKVMFTGDHVLPRITPNISVHSNNPPDSLAKYLDSLAKVGDIALKVDDCEGLPGHEYRYAGIKERTTELIEHHEERLEEVRELVKTRPGIHAYDLAAELTWSRSWESFGPQQRRSALGEAVAHVELLHQRGVVNKEGYGIRRWRIAEA